ncbi:MAG: RnfABCDGE type electron transport complex subunit G [Firmicutes bacterium]|nr:RnfABCDGE type electron transport complex subunit G [Bacillota bacterium]
MREVLRLGVVLLIICAVAGAVLAVVDGITRDRIAAQATIRLQQALRDVLPEAEEFRDETETLSLAKAEASAAGNVRFAIANKMYTGYSRGERTGFAFMCFPQGYGGVIETVVGVSSSGNVRGVSVIRHSETPGLGASVATREFQMGFVGIPAGTEVKVKKDGGGVDAIAGATVSSRAVANAVNEALQVFEVVSGKGALENEL